MHQPQDWGSGYGNLDNDSMIDKGSNTTEGIEGNVRSSPGYASDAVSKSSILHSILIA